jgi:putative acetyltransferase
MTAIRLVRPEDEPAIRAVLTAAFPSTAEADLVERLVAAGHDELALVAENAGQLIGYLLFSPVTIEREGRVVAEGLGLAPLAVMPAHQRQGIGTQLTVAGLQTLEAAGCPFVVVLGHPAYYRRFGFVTASEHGLANEYGADDAFMVLAIDEAPPPAGLVKYGPEFAEL